MADNTPQGGSDTIATDDVGGIKYQRTKVDWGADGVATDVDRTSAASLPVYEVGTATGGSGQVTISNTSATIIAARAGRRGVLLLNRQTVDVAVDASGGTAVYATHFCRQPGTALFLPVAGAITGITENAYTATGELKVHYIEVY